jgi:very-short-patch-repair endonuclease
MTVWASVIDNTLPQYELRRYGAVSVISKADPGPLKARREVIVAGYASPQVIDRDKHVITKEALAKDLPRFMAHPKYRNVNLLHCLEAGTQIQVPEGVGSFKPIEQIEVGDRVYTHKGRIMPVTEVFKHKGPDELIELTLENGVTVRLTDEHQILVVDRGWIRAGDLAQGDILHHLVDHEPPEMLVTGVRVVSATRVAFEGWVYNVEVDGDHSYAGDGIVFHNSNVQVGEVIPSWTDSETGKRYETKVDDVGLFVVVKIRTDPYRPPIVDKVIEDIESGKIASFSISADAPFESRRHECANGTCFWVIHDIVTYEITLAAMPGTVVTTAKGDLLIEDVQVGDQVFTHRRRRRMVNAAGMIWYTGDVIRITTDDGAIEVTPEHQIRIIRKGQTRAHWIDPTDINEGDTVVKGDNFRGGIRTVDGRKRQIAGVTSPEFRKKRAEIMRQAWADPSYRAAMVVRLAETRSKHTRESYVKLSESLKASWDDERRRALSEEMRDRWLDIEYKERVIDSMRETASTPERREAHSMASKAVMADETVRARIGDASKQRWQDDEYRRRVKRAQLDSWDDRDDRREGARQTLSRLKRDPAFNEARFKSLRLSPNNLEKSLWARIGEFGYLYTGDGKLITKSGLCPDFEHRGKPKVVEVFGDYWHAGQDPLDRIQRLKGDGFDSIIVWEREVNEDIDGVVRRIEEFTNA